MRPGTAMRAQRLAFTALAGAAAGLVALLALLALAGGAQAATEVCGDITASTTWTEAGSPYVMTCSVTVRAPLTVESGVVVKFDARVGLTIGASGSNGQLAALGTAAKPIVFTSNQPDGAKTPDYWDGLWVTAQATAPVRLENATLEYGGSWLRAILYVQGEVELRNSVVQDTSSTGVRVLSGGSVTIADSILRRNAEVGLLAEAGSAAVTGTTFEGNGRSARVWAGPAGGLAGNTYKGNAQGAIHVTGGTLYGSHAWGEPVPYQVLGSMWLGWSSFPGNLTLAPGTTLRMGPGVAVTVSNGAFETLGTEAEPVSVTSDQPAGAKSSGYWDGIVIQGDGTGRFENTTIEYGDWSGSGDVGTVYVKGGHLILRDSTVQHSRSHGVRLDTKHVAIVQGTAFRGNGGYALWLEGATLAQVEGSTFADNGRPVRAGADGAGGLRGNAYPANVANAILVDGNANVYGSDTWAEPVAYELMGDTWVGDLGTAANLTLAPGTRLLMGPVASITTAKGRLDALGTEAQPILITSNQPGGSKAPGQWRYIWVGGWGPGGEAHFANTTIEYGGGYRTSYTDPGSVYATHGAVLTLVDSVIRHSATHGVRVHGDEAVTIRNTTFRDNADNGLWVGGTSRPTVAGNTFVDNGRPVRTGAQGTVALKDNAYPRNGVNAILVGGPLDRAGMLLEPATWDEPVPYEITGTVSLGPTGDGATLTLPAGATVLMGPEAGIHEANGAFQALGTRADPVRITSNQPDGAKTPGYWDRIELRTGQHRFENTTIEYGGHWSGRGVVRAYLTKAGAGLTMANSVVQHSGSDGLRLNDFTTDPFREPVEPGVVITGTTFRGNAEVGVHVTNGRPAVTRSTFEDNGRPIHSWAEGLGGVAGNAYPRNAFNRIGVGGIAGGGGTIVGNDTWGEPVPYELFGQAAIGTWTQWERFPGHLTLPAGATLHMGPGAVLSVLAGGLQALGTAEEPVTITSNKPPEARRPGDWSYIYLWAAPARFENTTIEYGGITEQPGVDGSMVRQGAGALFMHNSTVQHSSTDGIGLGANHGTPVIITDTVFHGNARYGVWVRSVMEPVVQGSTFVDNLRPIRSHAGGLGQVAGNSFPRNVENRIHVDGGGILGTDTWNEAVPYEVFGTILIGSGSDLDHPQLNLLAGTTLLMGPGADVYAYNGILTALGTREDPVVITSNQPEGAKTPGHWNQIHICGHPQFCSLGSAAQFDNVTIEYGGGSPFYQSTIIVDPDCEWPRLIGKGESPCKWIADWRGSVRIHNSVVQHSAGHGILLNRSNVQISNSVIRDNAGHGILAGDAKWECTGFFGGTCLGAKLVGYTRQNRFFEVTNTTFLGNKRGIEAPARTFVAFRNNTFQGNTFDAVLSSIPSVLNISGSWDPVAYEVTANVTVGGGARVALSAGATLRLDPSVGIRVASGAALDLLGQPARPVTIEPLSVERAPWGSLTYEPGSLPSTVRHALLRSGGSSGLGTLIMAGGGHLVEGARIERGQGVALWLRGDGNVVRGSSFLDHDVGLRVEGNGNLVQGSTLEGNGVGIRLERDGNVVEGTTLHYNGVGVRSDGRDNLIQGNTLRRNNVGLRIEGTGSTIQGNTLRSHPLGLEVAGRNNAAHTNTIEGNDLGLRATGSGNTFYNNLFENGVNAESPALNTWNVPKRPGTNIRGGAWIAGNVWDDYCGVDTDEDGIADGGVRYTGAGRIAQGGDAAPLIRAPVARADVSTAPVANLNQTGRFDASRSYDPEGRPILSAWWDFGDGSAPEEGMRVAHAYRNVGQHAATLTVTADDCNYAVKRVPIEVVSELLGSLVLSKGRYEDPTEPVQGAVELRFQNGEPVAGAEVAMLVAYNLTREPHLDAMLMWLDDSPTTVAWTGPTDAQGRYAFEAPYFLAEAAARDAPGLANPPGAYVAYLTAAWGGNTGVDQQAYAVGPPVPEAQVPDPALPAPLEAPPWPPGQAEGAAAPATVAQPRGKDLVPASPWRPP